MKKLSKQKRSQSPFNAKTLEVSQRKKKPSIQAAIHELESTQNRTERKKSVLSKESLGRYSNIKERIVTEPVENFQRLQHLVKGSIVNNSSLTKIQLDRKKNELIRNSEKKLQFHIKNPVQHLKTYEREQSPDDRCMYCSRNREAQSKAAFELEAIKAEIDKIIECKQVWKQGKMTLEDVNKEFLTRHRQSEPSRLPDMASVKRSIQQLKFCMIDLMEDIQSLSKYDFKKMLKSQIFTYDVYTTSNMDRKLAQAKQIMDRMKESFGLKPVETKLSVDLQHEHSDLMLRNLKSRLNQAIRQNLQMKVKKNIISRIDEMRSDQEEYIRRVIKDVIDSY